MVPYDSVGFTVFNRGNTRGILSNRLTSLFEDGAEEFTYISQDHEGSIWMASKNARLHHLIGGVWKSFPLGNIPAEKIEAAHEDNSGGVWVGAIGAPLSYLKDGQVTNFGVDQGTRWANTFLIPLMSFLKSSLRTPRSEGHDCDGIR